MNNQEEWRDIKGYEGYYQISSFGRVRSVDRLITRSDGRIYCLKSKILKPFQGNTCNYLSTQLSKNNVCEKFMIHRLVAYEFLGLSHSSLLEVNHKDGNRHNNRVSNLEVVTHQQNIDHSIITNLKNDYGECSINAKLTNRQADEIRWLWENGMMQKDIAKMYNVCKQTICNIIHHKRYFK